MSDLKYLTDENIAQAAEMVEIIHPLVLGENLRADLLLICEELATLRARHGKLREGLRATIARIDDEAKELPQEDWEEAFGLSVLAEELNALLEDE